MRQAKDSSPSPGAVGGAPCWGVNTGLVLGLCRWLTPHLCGSPVGSEQENYGLWHPQAARGTPVSGRCLLSEKSTVAVRSLSTASLALWWGQGQEPLQHRSPRASCEVPARLNGEGRDWCLTPRPHVDPAQGASPPPVMAASADRPGGVGFLKPAEGSAGVQFPQLLLLKGTPPPPALSVRGGRDAVGPPRWDCPAVLVTEARPGG